VGQGQCLRRYVPRQAARGGLLPNGVSGRHIQLGLPEWNRFLIQCFRLEAALGERIGLMNEERAVIGPLLPSERGRGRAAGNFVFDECDKFLDDLGGFVGLPAQSDLDRRGSHLQP